MDPAARDRKRGAKKPREIPAYPAGTKDGRARPETDVSAHERATEQALRDSQERLQFIYENNPTMYFIVDEAVTIQSVNRFGAEYLGYTVPELEGRSLLTVVHVDDHDLVRKNIADCAHAAGQVSQWEFRKVRKDGSILWVRELARGVPTNDSGGVAFLIVCEDITSEKRAAASQRFLSDAGRLLSSSLDYERTLRSVAHLAIPTVADYCIINMLDDAGNIQRVVMTHRDPKKEEIAQTRMARSDVVADVVRAVLHTGKPVLARNLSKDDLARLIGKNELVAYAHSLGTRSVIVTPLQARGRILGSITLVVSDRDYDESDLAVANSLASDAALAVDNAMLYREAERRARAERALRKAVAALHAAGTTTEVIEQIAMTAADATGADSSFVTRLHAGDEPMEIIGQREPLPPTPPGPVPSSDASFTRQVLEEGKLRLISRLGDLQGALGASPLAREWPEARGLVVPLILGEHRIAALFLIRAPGKPLFSEDEVRRASTLGQLASVAFGKRYLLEQSECRRQELERVTESRALLMRGFSHNVKNPLGVADGYAQMLEEGGLGELSERQLDSVEHIHKSIQSAMGVIRDLLEVTQAEAGQITVDRARTNVSAIAREAAEELRPRANEAGFAIEIRAPDELFVDTDAGRVRQVVDNVMTNAVKYGSTPITVTVERKAGGPAAQPGEWVAVSVTDAGRGIPADKLEAVFQEFVRLQPSGAWSSGLGLPISRRLARLLGGELTVESESGRGSVFTLWLPLG
jgi:PAS domain S-box-containing protein